MNKLKKAIFVISSITLLTLACDNMMSESVITKQSKGVLALPTGVITAFMGDDNAPAGWIPCDGRELDRVNFSRLYESIGTMYGNGNGSSTFNIPDLRGLFLRGLDGGSGRDPEAASRLDRGDSTTGDAVGTHQEDSLISHNHTFNLNWTSSKVYDDTNDKYHMQISGNYTYTTKNSGGSETRPKNISVRFMIKD
jgi:microcystin-dependent protein